MKRGIYKRKEKTIGIFRADSLREKATEVVSVLRDCGFANIVMMTGDSKHTAKAIAAKVGVDSFLRRYITGR